MAAWGPEIEWHERDVVVPAFRRWLEAHGWTTEAEKGYIDVVARRGDETIYAEVKGRTKGRPGAGLDTLYGQLLRRMPAAEVDDVSTRFAVVVPTGSEAAALRVPSRVRDLLRIDVYVVSDEGDVEVLIGDTPEREVKAATPKRTKPKTTKKPPEWKADAQYLLDHETIPDRMWTSEPRLKNEKRDAFIRRVLPDQVSQGISVEPGAAGPGE
jgi:Holliday junction resolvase-like predicted endonuclease